MSPLGRPAVRPLDVSSGFGGELVISVDKFIELALGNGGPTFSPDVHYIVEAPLKLKRLTIKSMPVTLTVKGRFDIRECKIETINGTFYVDDTFFISECPGLECISGHIETGKAFSVRGLKDLKKISAVLKVGQQIDAAACTNLVNLSGSVITVSRYLSLVNCKNLKELPTKPIHLGEEGYINLRGCTKINDDTAGQIYRDNKSYTIRTAREAGIVHMPLL